MTQLTQEEREMNDALELRHVKAKTDNRPVAFLELLEQRAKEICPDYPPLDNTAFDWLWAISCAYSGTKAANDSCHAFIKHLGEKLGMSNEELYNEFSTFMERKGKQ